MIRARLGPTVHPAFRGYADALKNLLPQSQRRRLLRRFADRLQGTDGGDEPSLALAVAAARSVAPIDASSVASVCLYTARMVLDNYENRGAMKSEGTAEAWFDLREQQADFHDKAADAFTCTERQVRPLAFAEPGTVPPISLGERPRKHPHQRTGS